LQAEAGLQYNADKKFSFFFDMGYFTTKSRPEGGYAIHSVMGTYPALEYEGKYDICTPHIQAGAGIRL
jgi:hypothetical protein